MDIVDQIITAAIKEDMPYGDITSEATIPVDHYSNARMIAKEPMIICGLDVSRRVFHHIDTTLKVKNIVREGLSVEMGDIVQEIRGKTLSILKAERIALNFLQRLSGIATQTRRYVDRVKQYGVEIWDTRKTTPAYRILEKMAVHCGGAKNHRMSLSDAVLIKENHITACRSITEAISRIRKNVSKDIKIEVETRNLNEVKEAIQGQPDIIMLDNMPIEMIKEAKSIIPEDIWIEVSGGVNLENIEKYAATGVSSISVGALTHHVRATDLSMLIDYK